MWEWKEELEVLNMEHIAFGKTFIFSIIFGVILFILLPALLILGCGLLISSVTFICEIVHYILFSVSPSSVDLTTKRRTWDVLQIIIAMSLFVPSNIFLAVACYDFIKDYNT